MEGYVEDLDGAFQRARSTALPPSAWKLWGVRPDRPALATVYAGTLDDSRTLVPAGHIWTRSAQPWIRIPDDVYRHETQPPDMAELLRAAKARAG